MKNKLIVFGYQKKLPFSASFFSLSLHLHFFLTPPFPLPLLLPSSPRYVMELRWLLHGGTGTSVMNSNNEEEPESKQLPCLQTLHVGSPGIQILIWIIFAVSFPCNGMKQTADPNLEVFICNMIRILLLCSIPQLVFQVNSWCNGLADD